MGKCSFVSLSTLGTIQTVVPFPVATLVTRGVKSDAEGRREGML
jgi:hypothetical protein